MQNDTINSEGVCALCNKTYKQNSINKHLKAHLTKLNNPMGIDNSSFLLKIETNPKYYGKTGYFLYLWVNGISTLDTFLRGIWLECCEHLSAFVDVAKKNESKRGYLFNFDDEEPGEIPMNKKVKRALYKGQKIEYTYDFGSSTDLVITVIETYKVKAPNPIVLLSRNEPLKRNCEICKKEPAIYYCPVHDWDEESLFCEKCAKKHAKECDDFELETATSIANSPRFGVCGYMGGSIDIERDCAYGFSSKKITIKAIQ